MYVEKILRKRSREEKRELKRKDRAAKWRLERERTLEEQRKLLEQYIEEARNDAELINQIPQDPDGSLYEELKEEYESVADELYDNDTKSEITGYAPATIDIVFDELQLVVPVLLLAVILLIVLSTGAGSAFMMIGILLIVQLAIKVERRQTPRFSKKRLRLAAECKVISEHLKPKDGVAHIEYEIV